jgi:hypothetical protein
MSFSIHIHKFSDTIITFDPPRKDLTEIFNKLDFALLSKNNADVNNNKYNLKCTSIINEINYEA